MELHALPFGNLIAEAPVPRTRRINLNISTKRLLLAGTLTMSGAFCAEEAGERIRFIQNVAAGSTNQVSSTARAAGIKSCATRIDQVSSFLTKGTQSNALLFLPDKDPDSSMISLSLEVESKSTPRAYGSATFSPNTAIGCAGMYETVQYWTEPCSMVATKHFNGATNNGTLGGEIEMLNIGSAARVFLMRTATNSSCISIKKEVIQ